jgi:hypothetical protein
MRIIIETFMVFFHPDARPEPDSFAAAGTEDTEMAQRI